MLLLLTFPLQELLQQLWQGLPVRFALRDAGMNVAVEKAALGRLEASEVRGMESESEELATSDGTQQKR